MVKRERNTEQYSPGIKATVLASIEREEVRQARGRAYLELQNQVDSRGTVKRRRRPTQAHLIIPSPSPPPSTASTCTGGNIPLLFQGASVGLRDADFKAKFLRGFLPHLERPALVGAARQVRPSSYLIGRFLSRVGWGRGRQLLNHIVRPSSLPVRLT